MSKRDNEVQAMPRFVFVNGLQYMRLTYKDKLDIEWTLDKSQASHYNSKYSAKQHLGVLRQNYKIPEVQIQQI